MGIQSGAFMSNTLNLHRANHTNHPPEVIRVVSRVMQCTPEEHWADLLRTLFYEMPEYDNAEEKRKG
jgi:hypothetical protein